jgi:iron(III) transport system substrate-binding protein
MMTRTITTWLAALAAAGTLSTAAVAEEITVYTSLEEDEVAHYLEVAKEDMPDLEVNVLRLSTGDLGARILAESDNPRHDVIWGWALTNMLDPRIQELTEPYQPAGIDRVPDRFKDPDGRWFAPQGYMATFCVNKPRLEEIGAPMPTSWNDLLDPAFKGEVVMPNPVSSGTGYLQIASLIQGMGEEKGWQFLHDLDANIGQYIKSGSRPCRVARAGEYAVGASFAFIALKSIEEGYPIEMVIPSEGAGYEMEANALMASSANKAPAQRFLDWTLSDNAVSAYAQYKALVSVQGAPMSQAAIEAGLPENIEEVLFPMDFARSAQERGAILDRWRSEIER